MGTEAGIAGFWSYANEDDRLDRGGILRLADLIANEFALVAGREIRIFADRKDLDWGDQWRERIDESLAETTFLIPIITPRYFTRPECVRELLDFQGRITASGLENLLLPILYAEVPDLASDSQQEVKSIIARTQLIDWRSIRLEGEHSPDFRKAVNKLALRLLEIDREVSAAQIKQELDTVEEPDDGGGIEDLMSQISVLLPDWLESVLGNKVFVAQLEATDRQHRERIDQLLSRGSPRSAIIATQARFGEEMLTLNKRFARDAEVYLARSVELDPLARKLIAILTAHPEDVSSVADFTEAITEAIDNFSVKTPLSQGVGESAATGIMRYLESIQHKSRTLKRVVALIWQSRGTADRGNEIVVRWWNGGLGQLVHGARFSPLVWVDLNLWQPRDEVATEPSEGA
jgi:hypothetical protein